MQKNMFGPNVPPNSTITIDGVEFQKSDPSLIKDCITEEWMHRRYTPMVGVVTSMKIDRIRNTGYIRADNSVSASYNVYSYIEGKVKATLYHSIKDQDDSEFKIKFNSLTSGICIIYNNPQNLEALINKFGWVRGVKNPNCYFDKYEIHLLDKAEPYRKFNYVCSKLKLSDIIDTTSGRIDNNDPEVREIVKNLIKRNLDKGVDSISYKEFEGLKYTYGIELETCEGRLEHNESSHLNVKAVHDGSLREPDGSNPVGGEYVTGVLVGDAGLSQLYEISRVLQTKCSVDKRCGTHVHIGSLKWNKEDVVYSYILAELVESDIFSILPKSRRNNSYCRAVDKITVGYLNALNSVKNEVEYNMLIDEIFNRIFSIVAGNDGYKPGREVNKNYNHPRGSKCGYDKAAQRYCWLNYVTLMFNTKGNVNAHTLEFRPMGGTLNYTKVKNWLKICMGFCSFVENHKSLIKNGLKEKITLETIVSKVYPKTGESLIKHINERRQIFTTADESIDYPVDNKVAKKSMKEVVCA